MTAPSRETRETCSCGTDLSRPAPDACRNIDHRSTDETLGLRDASCGCCVVVDAVALVRLIAEAEATDSAANELRELWKGALKRLDAAEGQAAEVAATALTVERERDDALERLAAARALADVDPFSLIPFGCIPLGDLREALGMDR